MRSVRSAVLVCFALGLGCYDQATPGRCSKDVDCPSGQACSLEKTAGLYGRCFLPSQDGGAGSGGVGGIGGIGGIGGSDGGGADTGTDVPAGCNPTCTDLTKPICDTATLTCVGCLTGDQCHDQARPVCQMTTQTCVGCVASTDCTVDPAKPVCNTGATTCVGCLSNGDCKTATAPICNTTTNTCVKCATDAQCLARDSTKPACDTTGGACFPCVDSKKHCSAVAPICDANVCRVCKKDAECATAYGTDPGLCVDGQCTTNDQVIYLQNGTLCSPTARGAGTVASPFCFSSDAVGALSPQKTVILVRGPQPITDPLALSFSAKPVVAVGQNGARFSAITGILPIVSVSAGDVTIRDLQISGGPGAGVSATGGILRMARCVVLNNADGGIKTSSAAFDITNAVVAGNMGAAAVSLGTYAGTGPTRFAFNTIVNNPGTGVYCGQAYALPGLLVNGNQTANLSPMCATDATSSTNAPQLDPVRPYHLTATSPCRDKAGTVNLPPDDIDGDTRPQGVSADCGADEYVP